MSSLVKWTSSINADLSQSRGEAQDLQYWQSFVDKFYAPGGVLRQGVCNPQAGSFKQFEISTPALARYYLTQFTSGIRQIQMVVEGPRERETPNSGHIVESPKTSFIYWFTNDSQVRLPTWFLLLSNKSIAFYQWDVEGPFRYEQQD